MTNSLGLRDVCVSVPELRELYPPTHPVAAAQQIPRLDEHCRAFIAHSPFVALGTTNPDGTGDVSPKGGPAGFVRVLDDRHLAVPDLPGNYRLDGLSNVISTGNVGMLFLIPGRGETLRVNGRGRVTRDPAILAACTVEEKEPVTALVVEVVEAFLHCSKAFLRSGLWEPERWPDDSAVAPMATMVRDHMAIAAGESPA
jgi:PPOX class probable FMN-dependent enzyme